MSDKDFSFPGQEYEFDNPTGAEGEAMDRDDALDYRMLYTKAIAEIERLRAAIREIQFDRGEDRNSVIEECARVVDECGREYKSIAAAIRALKDKTP